jgi:hypothetical protein
MRITKITDKYDFYQDGDYYILDLGNIIKGEDTTTELLLEGFNNPTLAGGCSCVSKTKNVLNETQVKYTLKYTLCERDVNKSLSDKVNNINIKIKGKCQ